MLFQENFTDNRRYLMYCAVTLLRQSRIVERQYFGFGIINLSGANVERLHFSHRQLPEIIGIAATIPGCNIIFFSPRVFVVFVTVV